MPGFDYELNSLCERAMQAIRKADNENQDSYQAIQRMQEIVSCIPNFQRMIWNAERKLHRLEHPNPEISKS